MKTPLKCLCGGDVVKYSDLQSTGVGRNSDKPKFAWGYYYRCAECSLTSVAHSDKNQALTNWHEMQNAVKINKEKNNEPSEGTSQKSELTQEINELIRKIR